MKAAAVESIEMKFLQIAGIHRNFFRWKSIDPPTIRTILAIFGREIERRDKRSGKSNKNPNEILGLRSIGTIRPLIGSCQTWPNGRKDWPVPPVEE